MDDSKPNIVFPLLPCHLSKLNLLPGVHAWNTPNIAIHIDFEVFHHAIFDKIGWLRILLPYELVLHIYSFHQKVISHEMMKNQ